ncbi:tyrosine-type recombinase/integrase [Altererythrobacter sp. GH1-8]|uniref:tyrosine-type recombinase/integrase n=1 Tax=Altererythrobacter sp. GH1-8 TaxID=3349333 RepID=UPI00374D95DF
MTKRRVLKSEKRDLSSGLLDNIFARCQGAYSEKTMTGYRNDLLRFLRWCESQGERWVPATADVVARFIDDQIEHFTPATLRRSIVALKFAHRMLEEPYPHESPDIYLALRRAARRKPVRPKQSLGLTSELLERMIEAAPKNLPGMRDAALVSFGYDTLCRSREIAIIKVEHLADDLSSVLIPFAKNDPFGQGRTAYLSPRSQRLIGGWLEASGIDDGPLFQGFHTLKLSGEFLNTSSIRRIVKNLAEAAELKETQVEGLSGHSMRIGAAQDMMCSGFDYLAIMQAGGWKSINVLARYVENAAAKNLQKIRWTS